MGKGISTINTVLKWGTTAANVTKVVPVKTVPRIKGVPEVLETTDLEDEQQTFCKGVQSSEVKTFTANYTKTDYDAVLADAGQELFYQLEFGDAGEDGSWSWKGEHDVSANDQAVNGVREMDISVIMSTKAYEGAATTIPSE